MSVLNGVVQHGSFEGVNRRGQSIVGERTGPGQWSGNNQVSGATFDATRIANPPGPGSVWDVTRTGPLGHETHNDLTVVRHGDQVRAYDLNRSGFQPLNPAESFDASIKGDPHFSVDGSINGQDVNAQFDNQDLGTRTQYAGKGFGLETTTVPWGDGNAAVVGSATVNTGFGRARDAVTVDASGALSVNGDAVSLEDGQTMQLNRTSSVTYEDGAYTVSSRNGKVTNTLTPQTNDNGNYLNIDASVSGVQTHGWLQNQV